MNDKKRMLILCTGNSARGQMAEGLLRHDAGERFEVESAGTKVSFVRPEAISVMRELEIDISGHRSKNVGQPLPLCRSMEVMYSYFERAYSTVRPWVPLLGTLVGGRATDCRRSSPGRGRGRTPASSKTSASTSAIRIRARPICAPLSRLLWLLKNRAVNLQRTLERFLVADGIVDERGRAAPETLGQPATSSPQ